MSGGVEYERDRQTTGRLQGKRGSRKKLGGVGEVVIRGETGGDKGVLGERNRLGCYTC